MADYVIDPVLLSNISSQYYEELSIYAKKLQLATPSENTLPWGAEKIKTGVSDFGQKISAILKECIANQALPKLENTPPSVDDYKPVHRIWVPDQYSINIPWEAAYNDGFPLFLNNRISLIRYFCRTNDLLVTPHLSNRVLNIMIAAAMPKDSPTANVELQRNKIEKVRQKLQAKNKNILKWFNGSSLIELRQSIIKENINAIHLIAHGKPGYILWQDYNHNQIWYKAEEFANEIGDLKLDFAILSVCDSATPINGGDSVVSKLISAGINTVVGMQGVIDDVSAADFTYGFYNSLIESPLASIEILAANGRINMYKELDSNRMTPITQWALPVVSVKKSPLIIRTIPDVANKTEANENKQNIIQPVEKKKIRILVKLLNRNLSESIFNQDTIFIGRSKKADIILSDAIIEPFHAKITRKNDNTFWLVDQGSISGTFLNSNPVKIALLDNNDVITIGAYLLQICLEGM